MGKAASMDQHLHRRWSFEVAFLWKTSISAILTPRIRHPPQGFGETLESMITKTLENQPNHSRLFRWSHDFGETQESRQPFSGGFFIPLFFCTFLDWSETFSKGKWVSAVGLCKVFPRQCWTVRPALLHTNHPGELWLLRWSSSLMTFIQKARKPGSDGMELVLNSADQVMFMISEQTNLGGF